MYKIISPTDFSEVSRNALLYAVSLINDFGGHIRVMNFYQVPHITGHQKKMGEMIREGAEVEMKKLLLVTSQWLGQDQTIDNLVIEGPCAESLWSISKEEDYDLIIMGSQNVTNRMKLFLGSTARAVINKVDLPTLIIPPGVEYRGIKNMVLADEGTLPLQNLQFLSDIGRRTQGHLHILHVGALNIEKNAMDHYGEVLRDFSYSFHNIEGDDILNSINGFAKEVKADLLVMTKRRKNFFQKLFGVSHTEMELFRSDIPLLILHEIEK